MADEPSLPEEHQAGVYLDDDFWRLIERPAPWTGEEFEQIPPVPEWPKIELLDGSLMVTPEPVGWTEAEYLAWPRGVNRIELLDGGLLVNPGFSPAQEQAARNLIACIDPIILDTWKVLQDQNVRCGEDLVLRPDVIVATRADLPQVYDVADVALAVDIRARRLGPIERDWRSALYADAGIPWYARGHVDPAKTATITVYRLEDGGYVEYVRARAGESLRLDTPFELSLDPAVLRQHGG